MPRRMNAYHVALLAVVSSVIFAVAGCVADGGGHGSVPSAEPSASADPESTRSSSPMNTRTPLLRRNPVNPRYFADSEGRAVYLTGSHTWNNLLDKGAQTEPFDWDFYLDFLDRHNHNFIRLWSNQSLPRGESNGGGGVVLLPWLRTGPGEAVDGGPRVDLTKFNPDYFERLRRRIRTAGERGIYVDVMLFEGWCATGLKFDRMTYHAFAEGNNVNGVNVLASPRENVYARWVTLDDPEIVALQELYVRKVVEAVNEFDNVLLEIANEPGKLSHQWQEHFIAFVRSVEAGLPKQHPVGTPGGMKTHNRRMFASDADWVSPDGRAPDDDQADRYREGTWTWGEPDYDHGDKVVILDTDHLWGLGGNVAWAWKSFCRGYNVIYMDPARDFPGAFFKGTEKWPNEPNLDLRREMGAIRAFALRVDLNHTLPANDLCSTGYCLAEAGRTYICFQPAGGAFTLKAEPGRYATEWRVPETGETVTGEAANLAGGEQSFTLPHEGAVVLLLERMND